MADLTVQRETNSTPINSSQENGSRVEKKEQVSVESSSATVNNKDTLARVMADTASQANIVRAVKVQPSPTKGTSINLDAYERIATGDKKFEQEIYFLKELCRFAESPSFEAFKKLPARSQYLIAARFLWNQGRIGWSVTPALDLLEKFEELYKKQETLEGVPQAIQEAIRIREKILFLMALQKAYVPSNTLITQNQMADPKNIRELDAKTYHEFQAKAEKNYLDKSNRLKGDEKIEMVEKLIIQKSTISNGIILLRQGYLEI